jgi:hypothetical protein
MKDTNKNLDRLLRAAAQGREEEQPAELPFGFETRVVALWRQGSFGRNGVGGLIRRVALFSALVLVVSTVAVVREFERSNEIRDATTNEFAIADTVIQNEFLQ